MRSWLIMVMALWVMVLGVRAEEPQPTERVTKPDEAVFLPYKERIMAFRFGSERLSAKYLGVLSTRERIIGKLSCLAHGLAVSSRGQIAFTAGNGTTPLMRVGFWAAPKEESEAVVLTYEPFSRETTPQQKKENEANAVLWFFSGQCAFDKNDQVIFTLGSCCDNGLFRIESQTPPRLRRLNLFGPSSAFQIPHWDGDYAYIARGNSIRKFRINGNSAESGEGKAVFEIVGDRIFMGNTLMPDANAVVASLSLPLGEKDERGMERMAMFSIYIDRKEGGYYLVSDKLLGCMALAQDHTTMLRQDMKTRELSEFVFQE